MQDQDQVEALGPINDAPYSLAKGDKLTVPCAVAKYWCKYGWAKSVEGTYETGERIEGARALDPEDIVTDAS